MWIGLFPSSARSVRFANGRLSFLHPGLRPSCNPFEVLTLGGSSLPLAAVENDPLDLSPGRGIHERVEREILLEKSASHECARRLPEDRHRREVFHPSLPRGNRFSNSSRLRPSSNVRRHFRASRTEFERKMSISVSRTCASCFVGLRMDAATVRQAYQPVA